MSDQNAAIYIRVSTEDQIKGSGLETQLNECQKYATGLGFQVVETYRDEGVSGTLAGDERIDFPRLLRDARGGKFKVLLVHALDRLGRDLDTALEMLLWLNKAGVKLIEARSGTAYEGQGALMALISLWGASEERMKILQRTKHGHIKRAKDGKVAGPPPLGYDKSPEGKLVINDEEAAVVRRIYDLYVNRHYGTDKIAALLNAEGIKTKRSKSNATGKTKFRGAGRWQSSTIRCALRNTVYMGTYYYGKTRAKVPEGREYRENPKRPLKNQVQKLALKYRDKLPHEKVAVAVPAIVTVEVWQAAAALLKTRASEGPIKRLREGAVKYTYRFPGLVRCHHCRRVMTPWKQPWTRKDGSKGEYGYYVCKNKDLPCPNLNKYHNIERIDTAIVARLVPYLRDPDLVRSGLTEHLQLKQAEHGELVAKLTALDKGLDELNGKLNHFALLSMTEAWAPEQVAHVRTTLEPQREQLHAERESLQARLAQLAFQDDEVRIEAVASVFESSVAKLAAAEESQRAVLDELIFYDNVEQEQGLERQVDAWHKLNPEGDLVKLVRALVDGVTVNVDHEIVDYNLLIDRGTFTGEIPSDADRSYKANLNSITSPSATVYSLPSNRTSPFSFAAPFDPDVTRSW